ncbi:unnamed protein product, partial [Dibothriocephalus latus]
MTTFGITLSADVFTCLEFNNAGDYLAAGDKSGRVYVFNNSNQAGSAKNGTYSIYCAFTSHEPEFDYLKSLEIEEKINAICWLPSINNSLHLLSTNDKVIKLWRIIPRYRKSDKLTIEVRPRRVFANAHTYHINAISVNSDQETFLSADDLRINLWHLDITNQSFTIVDLKPANMEELSEVITCSRFHPEHCHLFAYSTSRGVVRLCDMRQSALCDNHLMVLDDPALSQQRGFFADIIASLSDFRFDHSGNYILARDYLNLKVWDVRNGSQPCEVYSVHEPLRSQLCMLYESDGIFDKFLCSWSEDDRLREHEKFFGTSASDNLKQTKKLTPVLYFLKPFILFFHQVVVDLASGSTVVAGKSFNKDDDDEEEDEVEDEEAEEEEGDDEESTQ